MAAATELTYTEKEVQAIEILKANRGTKLSAKVKLSVKCIKSLTLSSGQGSMTVLQNVPRPDNNGIAYIKDSVTGFTFSASSGRFYLESPFTITLNNSYSTGWMFYYVRQ